jgi:hypothetical protein
MRILTLARSWLFLRGGAGAQTIRTRLQVPADSRPRERVPIDMRQEMCYEIGASIAPAPGLARAGIYQLLRQRNQWRRDHMPIEETTSRDLDQIRGRFDT